MTQRRPDVAAVLAPLKDFQRRTVDYAFRRMFTASNPANRFLVADEVGLGKTLVARGLIAKAVDHWWDTVPRIDVLYICSNGDIARQNVRRLAISGDDARALASRITLLPLTVHRLNQNRLNFIAFTPGTSFSLKSASGIGPERALIYHMLRRELGFGRRAGPKRVFMGDVSESNWPRYLRDIRPEAIDSDLAASFVAALRHEAAAASKAGRQSLIDRCQELAYVLARPWNMDSLPPDLRRRRTEVVGAMRDLLAKQCIRALEPDLIILDEFQRFRHLLDRSDPLSDLAFQLFDFRTEEGHEPRVLLLSATPYKMYTLSREGDEDHHEDFLATMRFLYDDAACVEDLRSDLIRYRHGLLRLDKAQIAAARGAIEGRLRRVMCRTEREAGPVAMPSMVRASANSRCRLIAEDIGAFVAVDRFGSALGMYDHVEYWKSAPYLLNFMEGYALRKRTEEALADGSVDLTDVIEAHRSDLLWRSDLEGYEPVDLHNAKLRILAEATVDRGAWRLLWVPPSLPYYEPEPPYDRPELRHFTKSLVFSAWRMVPKVIATMLSYEAERLMVRALDDEVAYAELRDRRRPLLRFQRDPQGRLTGLPVLTLLYPCATLASKVDPLTIAAGLAEDGSLPPARDVLAAARAAVADLLAPMLQGAPEGDAVPDESWYWSALAQLDAQWHAPSTRQWLESRDPGLEWARMVRRVDSDGQTGRFAEHVAEFRRHVDGEVPRGAPPEDLVDVVTLVALAGPATCALRGMARQWPRAGVVDLASARAAAARVGMGFRTLYNLPESITLLRGQEEGTRYWQRTLEYGVAGNLQAVLDEYVHVLREWLGHVDDPPADTVADIGTAIQDAVSLRTANLTFEEFTPDGEGRPLTRQRVRCRFALPFADQRSTEGAEVRADDVRLAFNSPFRPFVLATTSIGQEGLDFHLYCHAITHWNLPANPVDFEQREGRIHRYKGHAVRRNVALRQAPALMAELAEAVGGGAEGGGAVADGAVGDGAARDGTGCRAGDPWRRLFDLAVATRRKDASDMVPFWVYPDDDREDGRSFIVRSVPIFPFSRDVQHLADLRASLAVYRMVFGQPNQEDLAAYVRRAMDADESVREVIDRPVDLSPQGDSP